MRVRIGGHDFTVVGSYVGEGTPIWVQRIRYSDINIA